MEVTTRIDQWVSQQQYVERLMDDSEFTAAHPDDTLLMAGPARVDAGVLDGNDASSFIDKLLPIGMVMNIGLQTGVPSNPARMLGSGRSFGIRDKSSTSFSFARLLVGDGRSALRSVHTTSVRAGIDPSKFADAAATSAADAFWHNLDSEQYYIPFGLYLLVSNKARQVIAFLAMEAAHLNSHAMSIQAGQPMVLENISGWCDRVQPLKLAGLAELEGRASLSTVRTALGMPPAQPLVG